MDFMFCKDGVVDLLNDFQWHTGQDIRRVGGLEGTRRLRELREERGWTIEKRKIKGTFTWEYRRVS